MTDTRDDALYALVNVPRAPTAETLERVIAQYPEHEEMLTEVALAMLDEAHLPPNVEPSTEIDRRVSEAMSWFENHRWQAQQAIDTADEPSDLMQPFAGLDRLGYGALAQAIGANRPFMVYLRDRMIVANTIPLDLVESLAGELTVPVELMTEYFSRPPEIGRSHFNSDTRPAVSDQMTYAEAVKTAGLTAEQQEKLLSYR